MSVQKFKIKQGIDLEGLLLTKIQDSTATDQLAVNGTQIASITYVNNAINGVTVDPSGWAGTYLDWNSGTSQFDVNIPSGTYLVSSDLGNYVTLDGTETLSNKTFEGTTNFKTPTNSPAGSISGSMAGDLEITASNSVILGATSGGIYIGSYGSSNEVATHSYVGSQGFLTNADLPTMYSDADAVNAISNALITNGGLKYLTNVGFEVDTNVIATKAYVDATAQGLDVKASVKAASSTNVDINSGSVSTIDGVGVADYDRFLLKGQTDPSENGIYYWSPDYTHLVRADDATFDIATGTGTLTKGAFTFVEGGDTNSGKGFVVSNIVMNGGVYSNTWTQFSETGNYITSVGSNLAVFNGLLSVDLTSKADATNPAFTIGNSSTLASYPDVRGYDVSAMYGYGVNGIMVQQVGTAFDLSTVQVGDTVTISGGSPAVSNPGTFTVTGAMVYDSEYTTGGVTYKLYFMPLNGNPGLNGGGYSSTGQTFTISRGSSTTISATEVGYLDGVTSNIQTQLDNKQDALSVGSGLYLSGSTLGLNLGDGLTIHTVSGEDRIVVNTTSQVLETSIGNGALSTKKAYYAESDGLQTQVTTNSGTVADVTLKIGNRISKIAVVGSSWTEYAIVDNNTTPANVNVSAMNGGGWQFAEYDTGLPMTLIIEIIA